MIDRQGRGGRPPGSGAVRARVGWMPALVGAALALVATSVAIASAQEVTSGFGFRFSVPETWLVLTRDEVAANADAFVGREGGDELAFIPDDMRRMVYERVMAGELEVLYRRGSAPGTFVDNVNVLVQRAKLPASPEEVSRVCELLPGTFSRVFGRPIAMDVCEMRERVGRRAFYLEFDGAIEGTKSMQYQLSRESEETLVVTATVRSENLARMQDEFEAMIASIRLE